MSLGFCQQCSEPTGDEVYCEECYLSSHVDKQPAVDALVDAMKALILSLDAYGHRIPEGPGKASLFADSAAARELVRKYDRGITWDERAKGGTP